MAIAILMKGVLLQAATSEKGLVRKNIYIFFKEKKTENVLRSYRRKSKSGREEDNVRRNLRMTSIVGVSDWCHQSAFHRIISPNRFI